MRLAAFCLPIVLSWAALEWWAARVPNLYSCKRERFESLAKELDTLVLGSSSAFYGIDPRLLPGSAFNLAAPSEGLYETDGLVTRVLPGLPKLKRVIINVNYLTIFDRIQVSGEGWRQYCYEQEWKIPPEQVKDRLDSSMWSRLALRTPHFYLHLLVKGVEGWIRNGKFACVPPEIDSLDDLGWWHPAHQVHAAPDLSRAEARFELDYQNKRLTMEDEPEIIAHLDHLLSTLRQRNIQVVFVTTPVWHDFMEGMRPKYWTETQRVVAQRTNAVSVWYYSFLSAPQFGPQDFADVTHLSPRGADRFTEVLNSVLKRSEAETNKTSANMAR
jgi:hypothetical protein